MNTFLTIAALLLAQPAEPVLRFQPTKDNSAHVIARLPADFAAKFPKGRLTQDDGESILRVSLVDDETKKAGPAMLGAYDRKDSELTFVPRFRLDAGQTYLAEFNHPRAPRRARPVPYRGST